MKKRPFRRDELMHLKYLLKTRDGMSEKEATKHIEELIDSQNNLPTPPRKPKSPNFQEEFKKLKAPRKNPFGDA